MPFQCKSEFQLWVQWKLEIIVIYFMILKMDEWIINDVDIKHVL